MNYTIKHSFIVLSTVFALGVSACTEEAEYTPAGAVNGDCILASFVTDSEEYILGADDVNAINVTVNREKTEGEATVRLTPTYISQECFRIPESVTFAAGSATTNFDIEFLADQIEEEEFYTYSIGLEEAAIDPYSENTVSTTTGYVLKQAQWPISLGTGYFSGALDEANTCEVLQTEGRTWYKVAPFGYEVVFKVDEDGTVRLRQQDLIYTTADEDMGPEVISISKNSAYDGVYNYYDPTNNTIIVAADYIGEFSGSLGTGLVILYLP